MIATVGGVLSLIEIKSRAYNPILDPLQAVAYMEAANEKRKEKIKQRYFCELGLNGVSEFRKLNGRDDFHYFRCCLAAWNWRNGGGLNSENK